MVLHRLGALGIHWRHLLPRNANGHVVVNLLRRGPVAAGSVPVTTAFKAALYPLAPAVEVADGSPPPVGLLRVC